MPKEYSVCGSCGKVYEWGLTTCFVNGSGLCSQECFDKFVSDRKLVKK